MNPKQIVTAIATSFRGEQSWSDENARCGRCNSEYKSNVGHMCPHAKKIIQDIVREDEL
jgi:hypothetical protein